MRALILVALLGATANASTIVELGPAALERGADRVVDARVLRSDARWNARHTQIETHAVLAIEGTHKGAPATHVEIERQVIAELRRQGRLAS